MAFPLKNRGAGGPGDAIPENQRKTLACSCGCELFVLAPLAFCYLDRLNHARLGFEVTQGMRCASRECGRLVTRTEDGKTWTTIDVNEAKA